MNGTPARDTIEVILDGAMRALARHGTTRLSMTDICREAGVSRGTLYRYFTNREEVLDAVNLRIVAVGKETFDRAVERNPDPDQRIQVILHEMLCYPETFPHMRTIFEYEPKLALTFLTGQLPGVADILAGYLEPAVGTLPAGRAGLISARDLAELLYRLVTSAFLLPATDPAILEARIAAVVDHATGRGNLRR